MAISKQQRLNRWYLSQSNVAMLRAVLANPVIQEAMELSQQAGITQNVPLTPDGQATLVNAALAGAHGAGWAQGLQFFRNLTEIPKTPVEPEQPWSRFQVNPEEPT